MKYSVVVPVKNEEGNIAALVHEVEMVMNGLKAPWELIFVDDGSTDSSLKILQDLKKEKKHLRIISFTKNFGQSSAFDAGFKAAQGEFVITLDGDRQNDPNDIPKLLAVMDGCDLACGWRVNRKDSFSKKFTSKLANALRSKICRDGVNDTGCSLKVYRKSSLQQIKMFHGMHRFLPALFNIEGFVVKEVPVNHRPRTQGTTKYNFFNRSFNTIADMLAVRWMRKRHLHYSVKKDLS